MALTAPQADLIRDELLSSIDSSGKGSYRIKIKNLLAKFDFSAVQRVRRDSLQGVFRELESWGIEWRLVSDVSADSFVSLSRSKVVEHAVPDLGSGNRSEQERHQEEPQRLPPDPLLSMFWFNSAFDERRARSLHHDLLSALWTGRPVLLLIQASDDLFAFIAGYVAALMRRRQLTSRRSFEFGGLPDAPELVTAPLLRALTAQSSGEGYSRIEFPYAGAVYLLRDLPDQTDEEDLAAFVREALIPNSYRMEARSSQGDPASLVTAGSESLLPSVFQWLTAFAGTPMHSLDVTDGALSPQLATLLAEAAQTQTSLLEHAALTSFPTEFRVGFESTEHMILKGIMLEYLQRRYPGEKIATEQVIETVQETDESVEYVEPAHKAKPDLHVAGKLCVEVETLRDICLKGSSPFVSLEVKFRKKLSTLSQFPQIWILVPSDVALLASNHMVAVARNLEQATAKSGTTVRFGYIDLERRVPVLAAPTDLPETVVEFRGVSWRSTQQKVEKPLSIDDIAGYSDIKRQIANDVLDPLLNPERYANYGLSGASGLLLYGLPGCGKSLIGKVLAGMTNLTCRRLLPSDLTSMWLGQGVGKIRDAFDWALKQAPCLLILDEIDAVAPQRSSADMHSDERRQVNELLAQLDRISGKQVMVVGTTNYMSGIDSAIRRSGRFDLRVPVFPPNSKDRAEIFSYYLQKYGGSTVVGIETIDPELLAAQTRLFTPADIKAVVELTLRRALLAAGRINDGQPPSLTMIAMLQTIRHHPRSIQRDDALRWIAEASNDLGPDDAGLRWLSEEVAAAYGE